jgi:hypothetical protein
MQKVFDQGQPQSSNTLGLRERTADASPRVALLNFPRPSTNKLVATLNNPQNLLACSHASYTQGVSLKLHFSIATFVDVS